MKHIKRIAGLNQVALHRNFDKIGYERQSRSRADKDESIHSLNQVLQVTKL